MKNKNFSLFLLVICVVMSLFACKKEVTIPVIEPGDAPNLTYNEGEYNLGFNTMHNFVIDTVTEMNAAVPFFFVLENQFDISGDNDQKYIKVTLKCMDQTTIEDVDLLLSLILNAIGTNASEQDFRFETPEIGDDGSYTNFGTVFDEYDLILDVTKESGEELRKVTIKKGTEIPIDPRYWSE